MMHADQPANQVENEFRNIKLKLKGPNRHSELQAVKALMAMSAQHSIFSNNNYRLNEVKTNIDIGNYNRSSQPNPVVSISNDGGFIVENNHHDNDHHHQIDHNHSVISQAHLTDVCRKEYTKGLDKNRSKDNGINHKRNKDKPMDLSRSESPEPIYGLAITMTEEEFKELTEREGIEDVIGEPICKLCGGLFSGPLGIALHMCPAMKRQTYRCDICGEDKWKTKANLHSHIKWCKKRLGIKTEQHEPKQVY